jgi:S-adenosylmethionine synthetase
MKKVTFFSTSKPVIDKKTDAYPNIISNSIESELRGVDSDVVVSCVTQIQNSMAFITGEVTADSSIDVSAIVRKKINRLFQKDSLSPST